MTDEAPLSSYSDPIYDRLEGIVRVLGRRWWAILAVALATVVLAMALQRSAVHTPAADGALALREARQDGPDALQALAEDESILAEFRAKAALAAVKELPADSDPERIDGLLILAASQAQIDDNRSLQLAVALGQAAVLEDRGEHQRAFEAYASIEARAGAFPVHAFQAALGSARCLLAQAEQADDPEASLELQHRAADTLDAISRDIRAGSEGLVEIASLMLEDLRRRNPALAVPPPAEALPPRKTDAADDEIHEDDDAATRE